MCLALMDGAVAFIVVIVVGKPVAVKTNMTITKIIIIILGERR